MEVGAHDVGERKKPVVRQPLNHGTYLGVTVKVVRFAH